MARNILDRSGDFCLDKRVDVKRKLASVTGRILFLQNVNAARLHPRAHRMPPDGEVRPLKR